MLTVAVTGLAPVARAADPVLNSIFTPAFDASWRVATGTNSVSDDKAVGRKILIAAAGTGFHAETKTNLTGGIEARLVVRLRTVDVPSVAVSLVLNKKNGNDPGLQFFLQATRGSEWINCCVRDHQKALYDSASLTSNADWNVSRGNDTRYCLQSHEKILPGWPEYYRILVAEAMAQLPDHNSKWIDLRVSLLPGRLRVWVDDRLIAEKEDGSLSPDGFARVELSAGVHLASVTITPLSVDKEPKGFVPLRLGGYANARGFLGNEFVMPDSLPVPDQLTNVGPVPFIFPGVNAEGNDHIDVGRSLLRECHLEGYLPANEIRFAGSLQRDPARIQLRIPRRAYDRLYLVCASDGDKEGIPVVSASFYRPSAGFAEFFAVTNVPLATVESSGATPVPVTLGNGKKANLWLVTIPLDPGKLSSFSDMDIFEVELTKKIYQYRSYPDPISYGWHQGGRPSSVHVYAATLGEAPVTFEFKPDKFGHVWTEPEVPGYTAVFSNTTAQPCQGKLTVVTRSYDGTETNRQEQAFTVPPGQVQRAKLTVPVKLYGYHDVVATAQLGDRTWEEKRSLARLAPDTRSARWEAGKGALFGYWSYYGGHHTPKPEHQVNMMVAAGARCSIQGGDIYNLKGVKEHFSAFPDGAWKVQLQGWAREEPYDQAKYNAYKQEIVKVYSEAWDKIPPEFRPDHVFFFPEPHISLRLTTGNYPEYWGGAPYEYTPEEKDNLRVFTVTAKAAAEAIREKWPHIKVLMPWGDPLFIVPFLRSGAMKGLIDGSGLDICGFERLPEQQLHQISLHRLYQLKNEYAKVGVANPTLIYCEGIFVPTEVGGCSWREQMDIYSRFTLISMAYGVTRFYASWSAFDAASYYGAEHYACAGLIRRIPYCDPKPSYAAYATMSDRLNQANFDGWLKTGSLTTYALRFKGPKGNVYTLWTIRGKRPVTLTLTADAAVQVTDSMNNTRVVKSVDKKVTVDTDASVTYLTGAGDVVAIESGIPDHSDAVPAEDAIQVADLGDGTWTYTSKTDKSYEENGFGIVRFPGKFTSAVVSNSDRGNVLVSTLEKQDTVHELMPWYNILAPKKPIVLPGVPSNIGMWVKGNSDWGRVIYVLRDANGERWTSIGAKDDWNCDDVHSWCSFNFDGWRYLRFELPGNLCYDSYRKFGTTWWLCENGDKIVDLPLTLENVIVEQRTHILYANDVQPVATNSVAFGKIFIEYETPSDATEDAVKENRVRMPLPADNPNLRNPIAELAAAGVGTPTRITKLERPAHYYDGTRTHVFFDPAPGTNTYHLWVSAYPDGRGAVDMTTSGLKSGDLVYNLRPGIKLYYWVIYQDAKGSQSKPSPVFEAVLKDEFKEK